MTLKPVRLLLPLLLLAIAAATLFIYFKLRKPEPPAPLSVIHTLAGATADGSGGGARFEDPFGLAVDASGNLYVTDGEAGKLWELKHDGSARVIVENLETPSAVALAPDGSLLVAETGAHVIRRVHPTSGQSDVIAGTAGRAGFADGKGASALFSGPVGVAVGGDGTIYVADTYNDRIRMIDTEGNVRTLAGSGVQGYADAQAGENAQFDTPCGIAVAASGALFLADTGNHRIRKVLPGGSVSTFAGTGEQTIRDGLPHEAAFYEPTGITVTAEGSVYVTDARGSGLRALSVDESVRVSTLAGGRGWGFQDGEAASARLNRPMGVAVAPNGTIVFADSGNKLVRALVGTGRERGSQLSPEPVKALTLSAKALREATPARWPYAPPDRVREIAATFGEIRGEVTETDKEAWFHNGLDIPGGYGETVRALRAEKVLRVIAVEDVGTARERIRFPALGYIHVRIGRDQSERIFDDSKFLARRDEKGTLTGLRVRRGTRFETGEAIGTLNNQNHVHLIAGTVGAELNALAALDLPGLKDTVSPTIEKDGLSFYDASWREIRPAEESRGRGEQQSSKPLEVRGNVRLVLRAFDQMDGNAARRRLGLYKLGFQILHPDGAPVEGFAEPLMNISFERLPRDESSAQTAYAASSRSGATGQTIFAYIVTNVVRDGEAREGFWETGKLPAGDYLVRVVAEDYFGNRATLERPVRVATE